MQKWVSVVGEGVGVQICPMQGHIVLYFPPPPTNLPGSVENSAEISPVTEEGALFLYNINGNLLQGKKLGEKGEFMGAKNSILSNNHPTLRSYLAPLAISRDGEYLFLGDRKGLCIRRRHSLEIVQYYPLESPVTAIAISRDESCVFLALENAKLFVLTLPSQQPEKK